MDHPQAENPPAENLDETFGDIAPAHEGDADVIVECGHEHSWVSDRIAVGSGVWKREEVLAIKREGITHVIDCRREASAEYLYRGTGIEFFHCGTLDDGERKGDAWFGRGAPYGASVLARPGTKLLVGCAAGINRGPSMLYAIMRLSGFDAVAAAAVIKMARPIALIAYQSDAERWLASR